MLGAPFSHSVAPQNALHDVGQATITARLLYSYATYHRIAPSLSNFKILRHSDLNRPVRSRQVPHGRQRRARLGDARVVRGMRRNIAAP